MLCPSCGKESPDDRNFCLFCNTYLGGQNNPLWAKPKNNENENVGDRPSFLLKIIAFLLPLVGFILFFAIKEKQPTSANSYKTAAILGSCISAFATLIYYCIAGSADSLMFF